MASLTGTGPASGSSATQAAIEAMHHGAGIVDRSDRLRMRFPGAKAAETLTGLVTNDVMSLAVGRGQYAAALTPKGKVIADIRIFALADGLLVDTSRAAAAGWSTMIRKYVNPRLTKYADVSAELGDLGLFGPRALSMLRDVLGHADLLADQAGQYDHVEVSWAAGSVIVARVPDFGVEGYDVFGSREALGDLRSRLLGVGALTATDEALLVARIEAGRPEWGADMDDGTLAQEADLDRLGAISFTKGCYTGQETVARVHYRGHVNRLLRGLRLDGPAVPAPGTDVCDGDGKPVGTVRSSAWSPTLGAVALATVRREVEPGASVSAGGQAATVVVLPFPS